MRKQKIKIIVFIIASIGALNLNAQNISNDNSNSTNEDTEQTTTNQPTEDDDIDPTIRPFSLEWIFDFLGF
nr:hypothetical protein [uncultured Carboxylicivirga sp.]